jgi:hypothetical protein
MRDLRKGLKKGFERINVSADFEARKAVFYCNFLDSRDGIQSPPSVNKMKLRNAIDKLKTIAFGIDVNTQ